MAPLVCVQDFFFPHLTTTSGPTEKLLMQQQTKSNLQEKILLLQNQGRMGFLDFPSCYEITASALRVQQKILYLI